MGDYRESDLVDVVDEQGNPLPPVPKAWLAKGLVPDGVTKAESRPARKSAAGDELADAKEAEDAKAAAAASAKEAEDAKAELATVRADIEAQVRAGVEAALNAASKKAPAASTATTK